MGFLDNFKAKKEAERQQREQQEKYARMAAQRQLAIEEEYNKALNSGKQAVDKYDREHTNINEDTKIERGIVGGAAVLDSINEWKGVTRANNIARETARDLYKEMAQKYGNSQYMINRRLGSLYTRIDQIVKGTKPMSTYETTFYPAVTHDYILLPILFEYKFNNCINDEESKMLDNMLNNINYMGESVENIIEKMLRFYEWICFNNKDIRNEFPTEEAVYQAFPYTINYINSLKNEKGSETDQRTGSRR